MYLRAAKVKKSFHLCVMEEQNKVNKLKEWARLLYVHQRLGPTTIGQTIDYNSDEVKKWMEEEKWEDERKALLTKRSVQVEQLYTLLEATIAKIKEKPKEASIKDAELVIKYTTAIRNLDTEVSVAQIVEVAQLFTSWLRRTNEAAAGTAMMQLDKFIKHRLTEAA